jgi:hypothetical protein
MIRLAAVPILAFSLLLSNDSAAQQYGPAESTATNAPGPSFNSAAIDAERLRLQTRLRAALTAFDEMLSTTDERGRADWRAYLDWDAWAQPILNAADFRLVEMRRVAHRLYAPHDGFEHANIRNLRAALADYLTFEAAIAAARGDLAGEYDRRIAQLSRAATAQPLDFAELEEAAWWLAVTRQAPAELAALRAEFNQPPIILQVHRDLVEEKLNAFERTAHEQRDARQSIQGATVVGTANVSSHTVASLLDAPGEARLRVVTRGAVAAPHNVAFSGRVRVASSSNSQFTVTADIYWNGERFVAAAPQASADMHTRVKSIDAPMLIRRAAQRRVSASRGSAQAEAESNVERQAVESMTEHLDRAVDKLNDKSANFLNFIARTSDPAERWTTAVRPTSIEVAYMPRTYSGLAARPHSMPPLTGEETLGLSFHDSAIESLFRAQLAGKRWTDVDFAVMQRELTGGNTHEHMIGLEPERWNVDWSWRRPLSIHFTPDCAAVRYRFDRVEVDGYESTVPFEVRADIRVSAPPLGLEMDLLAPASVASLNPDQPLPPHIQQFLERKFRGLFGKRFSLDNLQFPAGGHLDGMSRFRVASARHDANWIHLRYTNRERNAPINRQGETSAEPIASRRSSQPTFPVSTAR